MNQDGYIKLHRKITDNKMYFSEPFTRIMAWIDLLLLANHRQNEFYVRGIKVTVERGQVGYGLEHLAKRWSWSRGRVERFISVLETEQQIVRQKNNVTTLISIVNYEQYQSDGKANSKANSKANGQQTVKQTDINNNDKNEKKDNTPIVVLSIPTWAENFKSYNSALVYPFEEKAFASVWDAWMEYRRHMKFKWTDAGQQAGLKKLGEDSENDLETAIRMIEQSMANGYRGIFKLKNNGKSGSYSKFGAIAQYKERCDLWEHYGEGLKGR